MRSGTTGRNNIYESTDYINKMPQQEANVQE